MSADSSLAAVCATCRKGLTWETGQRKVLVTLVIEDGMVGPPCPTCATLPRLEARRLYFDSYDCFEDHVRRNVERRRKGDRNTPR